MKIPETAADRIQRLRDMEPGTSIEISVLEMNYWQYAMRKAAEPGDRYFFSRRHGDARLIWRHS